MTMPNGTIFIDVGEDPDAFVMHDSSVGLRMPQDAHIPNMKMENVGAPGQPVESRMPPNPPQEMKTIKPEVQDEHNSLTNIQERPFKCPECKTYSAESEEKVERHIKTVHRGQNAFTCFMCDYSTYNKTVFEDHVRTHTGLKPFKCGHCDNRYTSMKNMKTHERIHRDDNPNKCKSCPFIAQNRQALANHKSKGCDHKPLVCPYCDFTTDRERTLVKHKATHKLMKCTICEFETRSERNFKLHKRSCSDKAKFKCSICNWSSSHEPKILLHLIHHPKQDVEDIPVDLTILKKYGIVRR